MVSFRLVHSVSLVIFLQERLPLHTLIQRAIGFNSGDELGCVMFEDSETPRLYMKNRRCYPPEATRCIAIRVRVYVCVLETVLQ